MDNTAEMTRKWIDEKIIDIEYIYKENGGLHTGFRICGEKYVETHKGMLSQRALEYKEYDLPTDASCNETNVV